MNEESMSPQPKERLLALLSLMGKGTLKVNVCPCDELVAAFIEGKLTGKARQAMLAHLNHCPSCYYHWLETASYLSALEPAAHRTSTASSSIWQHFQALLTGWRVVAIPAAAVALVCLMVLWPASPDLLNKQINAGYAAVMAQNAGELTQIVPALPLPWEKEVFGFSEAQPTPPAQAFGAGVWSGRQTLLGAAETPLPVRLSPPAGIDWPDTDWADYYTFGRWTVLVWTLIKTEQGIQNWSSHQVVLERLLAALKKRMPVEEKAKRAVAALERTQALLVALQQQANEKTRADLSRGLEITMQQLSP